MRLTAKITLVFTLIVFIVMGVNGYLWLDDEERQFDQDTRRDAVAFGAPLARAVERLARFNEGEAAVVVRLANSPPLDVRVRWVKLKEKATLGDEPRAPFPELADVDRGNVVHYAGHGEGDARWLFTYIPIASIRQGEGPTALEIAHRLTGRSRFLDATRRRVMTVTGILVLVVSLALGYFGAVFIARPLGKLIAKIKQVEAGNLSEPVHLQQRDELAQVATALNSMCEGLARARDALLSETAARVSAVEQLRQADRLTTVGRLAAGLAHEIGTPLAVVAGRAQMIFSGEAAGDEARDNARIVVEQTQRISKIIRQLLDFARKRQPQKGGVDLVALAAQMRGLLEPIASKRGVALTLADSNPVRVNVNADAGQLEQVVTNLVMNAVQATPKGGTVELRVADANALPPAIERGGAYACVSVRDTGTGMDAFTREHLFEPFFTTKDVGEGTGLGLAVAHGIVEEHAGFIEVASELGKGSRFTVYLPTTVDAIKAGGEKGTS